MMDGFFLVWRMLNNLNYLLSYSTWQQSEPFTICLYRLIIIFNIILKILQGIVNWLWSSLTLTLMPLYDLHKQRDIGEKFDYFCIITMVIFNASPRVGFWHIQVEDYEIMKSIFHEEVVNWGVSQPEFRSYSVVWWYGSITRFHTRGLSTEGSTKKY